MEMNKRKEEQRRCFVSRLLALVLAIALATPAVLIPQQAYAAKKSKSKVKYSITVHNIDSSTVLRKGTSFRISYTATRTRRGVTKGTKVKFKSSNKKIATVSSKGVIKAKKNGTVKITVYCKSKRSKKRTIKIRVSNYSNIFHASDARWIAHRGLHTSAIENTAAAFYAAGQGGGFWGCECDIWETRRVTPAMPALPGLPEEDADNQTFDSQSDVIEQVAVDDQADDTDPDALTSQTDNTNPTVDESEIENTYTPAADAQSEVVDQTTDGNMNEYTDEVPVGVSSEQNLPDVSGLSTTISSWPTATSMDILKKSEEVKSAWLDYTSKTEGLTEDQLKRVHKLMLTESGDDLIAKLFDAYKWVCEYESIDLAINHDPTFSRIWGNGNAVRDMSREEIRLQLPGVCFFAEYLDICKAYHMVPVIEFKDPYMSPEAINKALDMVNDRGLLDGAYLISFYSDVLSEAKSQAANKLGKAPKTYYLIADNGSANVDLAKAKGFTGVSFSKSVINGNLYNKSKGYGLGVGTWTYRNSSSNEEMLYNHMYSNGWQLDFVTVDYRIFR